jgi:serine/threonine protein kinase
MTLNHPLQDLAREALVWRQLKHPHVLEFVGIDKSSFGDTHFTCLVSPWMSRGTLKDYINSKDYDPDHDILRLVRLCTLMDMSSFILHRQLIESAEGLSYLHSQKVVHGDVKDVRPSPSSETFYSSRARR